MASHGAKEEAKDDEDYRAIYRAKKSDKSLEKDLAHLYKLQNKLYAGRQKALLIILQAMDTGGKDGTVRSVFGGINPQGCVVTSFKKPTDEELSHDYLWRHQKALPGKGMIGVFNRSHYENVLIVRVHQLSPKKDIEERYEQMNNWERHLTSPQMRLLPEILHIDAQAHNGYVILKFFLHISFGEQRARLEERIQNKHKNWKISPDDFAERKLWPHYQDAVATGTEALKPKHENLSFYTQEAYNIMLKRCNTNEAPWFVIPADVKWKRDEIIAKIIRQTLDGIEPKLAYPPPNKEIDLDNLRVSDEVDPFVAEDPAVMKAPGVIGALRASEAEKQKGGKKGEKKKAKADESSEDEDEGGKKEKKEKEKKKKHRNDSLEDSDEAKKEKKKKKDKKEDSGSDDKEKKKHKKKDKSDGDEDKKEKKKKKKEKEDEGEEKHSKSSPKPEKGTHPATSQGGPASAHSSGSEVAGGNAAGAGGGGGAGGEAHHDDPASTPAKQQKKLPHDVPV